ncbi:MAG: hypothetical protein AB8G23_05120 [Myxococcota bacterium]
MTRCVGLIACVALGIGMASPAAALIFASPVSEPGTTLPKDFPYWEHVTQRRYNSPSVIYLGGGWALTARHVGMGEIFLEGEIYRPLAGSRRTLMNVDGSPADAMVFALDPSQDLPEMPLLRLASQPPQPGEKILLIGFGRGRERVVEWDFEGERVYGFEWSSQGEKRWGTNRVTEVGKKIAQGSWHTQSISFTFDPPLSAAATLHEAHAAVGDSGGAVFVERESGWELTGLMTSVSGFSSTPKRTSTYGDVTFAAEIASYRGEILRWTRPACGNELDDDGDRLADYPEDPGCDSRLDRDERDSGSSGGDGILALGAFAGAAALGFILWKRLRPKDETQAGVSSGAPWRDPSRSGD